jgi:uncharacterized pyridoxamine 5'-phosphate oxidase family protein
MTQEQILDSAKMYLKFNARNKPLHKRMSTEEEKQFNSKAKNPSYSRISVKIWS